MARTAIVPVRITLDGAAPAEPVDGDAVNGHVVLGNDGERVFVLVENTSGEDDHEVTFVTPGTVGAEQYEIADKVEEIPAEASRWFGPFPLAVFTSSLQIDVANAALKLSVYRI